MKVQFVCVCVGRVVYTPAVARKCPQMASVQCTPGTHVKTAPRQQTAPKLTHLSPYTSLGQLPALSLPSILYPGPSWSSHPAFSSALASS